MAENIEARIRALQAAYESGDAAAVESHILTVWSSAPRYPGAHFTQCKWLAMFKMVSTSFITSSSGPLVVYRGARAEDERGMSWTRCHPWGRWFAARHIHEIHPGTPVGYVYKTEAPRIAILCETYLHIYDGIQNEQEVIIEPDLLEEVELVESVVQGQVVDDPRLSCT